MRDDAIDYEQRAIDAARKAAEIDRANVGAVTAAKVVDAGDDSTLDGDAEAIRRLAALSPLEYDRCRKGEAERLGVQIKTLDKEVKAARQDAEIGAELVSDCKQPGQRACGPCGTGAAVR